MAARHDDLGAQSSWYVWAALGLYPSTPGTPDLAVHSPLLERAVLDLPGRGRELDIRAPQASADAPYVHGLALDGRTWDRTYLLQSAVKDGARLDFTLSGTPDKTWATSAKAAPPSYRSGERSFLASATPNAVSAVPGGDAAKVTVHGQRLAGHDKTLTLTTKAPEGLTVSPTGGPLVLDAKTGSGEPTLSVKAAAFTDRATGIHSQCIGLQSGGEADLEIATRSVAASVPAEQGGVVLWTAGAERHGSTPACLRPARPTIIGGRDGRNLSASVKQEDDRDQFRSSGAVPGRAHLG
ncbi:glycoside hydrolase domain-containing protein [Streptomyces sp. AcE210]|uniref:glycoside hydrolase domain-containing protein n=1 Tax=Streptomyces sp. AcE210 TaxID=2292703 RepID=UPI000E30A296|nr:glycoside hydrolase domain-containing protein [Streptomyces sp. AcE210]RFC70108.1 hypothetical protein DXZ75_22220 [Streptomyces sp. AcE210]